MLRRLKLPTSLAFLVLSLLTLDAAFPQAIPRANPAPYSSFRQAKLVSSRTGWAVVDQPSDQSSESAEGASQHLYWTDDDGQTWREITPNPMVTRKLGNIFFLDGSHGWILASDALGEEEGARFYLYSTEDGGRNWRSLLLQRRMFDLRDDYTFPSQVFFSDPQHGWILWHWHMMNSSLDSLLATSDGGRTWKRLPDPPGGGPFQFISPRDGWMIGGPEVPDGIPVPEAENVWATQDGGAHWHVLPVSLPESAEAGETYFVDLRFKNSREGAVIAEQQLSGRLFRFMSCTSSDAGKSWHVSRFEAYHATPSFAGNNIIWSVSDWPAMKVSLRSGDHVIEPSLPAGPSPQPVLGDVIFVNESNGWASYFDGRPELVSTTDGGKKFRIITPPIAADLPIPPPELTGLNGILVKFPKSPLVFAPRPPIDRRGPPLGSPVGGPMKLRGNGFLLDNTVWIGPRSVHASTDDGQTLLFLVPQDLPSGNYEVSVENTHGKSNAIETLISPQQPFRISRLQNRDPRFAGEPGIHRGQQVAIGGTGFLIENTVWFGAQAVKAQLVVSMGAGLNLEVPATLPPGTYEVYVSNANGKSNVVSTVIE